MFAGISSGVKLVVRSENSRRKNGYRYVFIVKNASNSESFKPKHEDRAETRAGVLDSNRKTAWHAVSSIRSGEKRLSVVAQRGYGEVCLRARDVKLDLSNNR